MADTCRVLPGLAEPAGSGARTWPQRRPGGPGGSRRGAGVGRRVARAQPAPAADPGQEQALIARRLPRTWPHPVRLGSPPDLQIALCVALPFEHAAAVIEGLTAWGEDIQLHIYGWPWLQDQHWPTAIPSFTVRAIDDLGHEHDGHAGGWRGYGIGEAHAEFTLWPAVPRGAGRLRVVISTHWEARWADIELPRR